METAQERFVLCEIPGLIKDAHLGKGLGHDFLRHSVRTRVLIHLIDGSAPSPVDNMIAVNNELSLFEAALSRKPQIVVINKIDMPEVKSAKRNSQDLQSIGINVHFISASTGEGVEKLMDDVLELLRENPLPETPPEAEVPVLYPKGKGPGLTIEEQNGVFIVHSPGLERLVAGSDIRDSEVRRQIGNRLNNPRIRHVMERAGLKPGNKIRIADFEWIW